MRNKIFSILILICFIAINCKTNSNVSNFKNDDKVYFEGQSEYPKDGITNTQIITQIKKKNQDGHGYTNETVILSHTTEVLVIAEVENEYQIEIEGGYWCYVPKEKIIVGRKNIEEYKHSRLLSTFSEGPNDGYIWHTIIINYEAYGSVTKDILCSTIWQPFIGTIYVLVFYMDDVFKYGNVECGANITGKYKIENNQIVLYDINELFASNDHYAYIIKQEKVVLELKKVNTVLATDALVDIKNPRSIFYAKGSEPNTGDIVIIQGKECVYINEWAKIKCDTYPFFSIGGKQEKLDYSGESLLMKKNSEVLI